LDRARPGWKFEPTLVEVDGQHVRAYTGMAMRARMVTFLNPFQLLKIARLVQQAGVPLFGSFELHEPAASLEEPAAESEPTGKAVEELSGFRFTPDGPELGTRTPVEAVTDAQGNILQLA